MLADGEPQPLSGQLQIPMTVQGREYCAHFYVLTGRGPAVILGYPFYDENGFVIDCANRQLKNPQTDKTIKCHTHGTALDGGSSSLVPTQMQKN